MPEYTPKTLSTLAVQDIADYIRLDELTEKDADFLTTALAASKAFILKYTGLTAAQADTKLDLTIAAYVLCQDMYDTRTLYVDNANVNKVVEAILGLHSVNLL